MKRHRKQPTDRRTGLEMVTAWIGLFPSKAAAARNVRLTDGQGMDPGHLRIWLLEPERRFDPDTARAVAIAAGLPLEAILFKNERLCDLACERARRAA